MTGFQYPRTVVPADDPSGIVHELPQRARPRELSNRQALILIALVTLALVGVGLLGAVPYIAGALGVVLFIAAMLWWLWLPSIAVWLAFARY